MPYELFTKALRIFETLLANNNLCAKIILIVRITNQLHLMKDLLLLEYHFLFQISIN